MMQILKIKTQCNNLIEDILFGITDLAGCKQVDEADKMTSGQSCRISSLHYDDVYRRGLKVKVQNLVAVWTVMEDLQY